MDPLAVDMVHDEILLDVNMLGVLHTGQVTGLGELQHGFIVLKNNVVSNGETLCIQEVPGQEHQTHGIIHPHQLSPC